MTEAEEIVEPKREGSSLIHPFAAYYALGDSMSMDLYPRLDALKRPEYDVHGVGGAATLLHFKLLTHQRREQTPYFAHFNYTQDGATTNHLRGQIARCAPHQILPKGAPVLISITIGGNDILQTIPVRSFQAAFETLNHSYERLVQCLIVIERIFGDNPPTILLNNVYDPTDGEGFLKIHSTELDLRTQMGYLEYWNDLVFEAAKEVPGTRVIPIDLRAHFLGHGYKAQLGVGAVLGDLVRTDTPSFWYWPKSWIEPGVRGAEEMAGLWWKAIQKP